ncbi:MAG: LPS export ABC transporter permease LptF [Desulfobacterales bacterium]|uniref:LPS export ABC transporter permease LptF n=1 Tax=Candidatus Desulfatibia vada TaxID=2841696 RepID=A0A8J6P5Z1_9BACT|nr:LPS export ABC transporter permease LptF [Candidatus Desulfatibia vada]
MKINSIVNRYFFTEMIPPFTLNIVFFTFVFLMAKILDITKMIVNYKISISSVFLLLLYSIPHFLEFVIPLSIMMSILLTFLRLSADNEIVALKAGGFSIYRLLPPAMLFCLLGFLLTGFMSIYGVPWGRLSFKDLTLEVVSSNAKIGLKERTFNDSFKDVMLYMSKIDLKNKILINVFIEDKRNKNIVSTVVAPRGNIFNQPDSPSFHLRLYDGSINQVDIKNQATHSIKFDTYDINLDLERTISAAKGRSKDEKEMNLVELRQHIQTFSKKDVRYFTALTEFHKKFSIAFACFALGILAVPLGIQSQLAKRSFGLGLGLFFFLLYYLMLSAGWVFGETGVYPPVIGMWLPNVVMGGLGLFLLDRTAKERPVNIRYLPALLKRVIRKSCR